VVIAVEDFSELRLGVLMIFAEAQAWAHTAIDKALAERAALSAAAHNRGRTAAQKLKEPKAQKVAPAPRAILTREQRNARRQKWRELNRKAGRASDRGAKPKAGLAA
jgi:hypothetical protein